jgi:hypothetical protein
MLHKIKLYETRAKVEKSQQLCVGNYILSAPTLEFRFYINNKISVVLAGSGVY